MAENIILTIATGDAMWGEMALNLCLSIKASNKDQKVGIIYTASAVESIKGLADKHFDYGMCVFEEGCTSGAEIAFRTKTRLFDIGASMCPDADAFIFIDADVILLPDKKTDDWFAKHKALDFTSYCNDFYHYSTGQRKRKDYTFWCNPNEVFAHYKLHRGSKLPQVNSSWLYWKNFSRAKKLFDAAKEIWDDDFTAVQKYRGAKPDEFCFNVACAKTEIYPHQNTYRPLFFQCFSENYSSEYVHHFFKGFGFAGNSGNHDHIIAFYNEHANYYRSFFGIISDFKIEKETKAFSDIQPVSIKPFRKRTLYRAGELPNSDAGVFNPDGITIDNDRLMIFRKEGSMDAYNRYKTTTSVPHIYGIVSGKEYECELAIEGFSPNERVEDFRIFAHGDLLLSNHSVVTSNHTDKIRVRICLSEVTKDKLIKWSEVELPIRVNQLEKNWVFFSEGSTMYCIYSISPYVLFKNEGEKWEVCIDEGQTIDFVHDGRISNSTNPIRIGDDYLTFFHTKESGIYYRGAALIDGETKRIKSYTKHTIQLEARNDGWQKGLHYVSGLMELKMENAVRVFYGENDTHACCADFKTDELIKCITDGL